MQSLMGKAKARFEWEASHSKAAVPRPRCIAFPFPFSPSAQFNECGKTSQPKTPSKKTTEGWKQIGEVYDLFLLSL
jgi:hypothetical protein